MENSENIDQTKLYDLADKQARLCGLGLRFMRESRNVTVEELAEATGLSAATINAIETGKCCYGITLGMVSVIATALDANVPMTFDLMTVNVGAKFFM